MGAQLNSNRFGKRFHSKIKLGFLGIRFFASPRCLHFDLPYKNPFSTVQPNHLSLCLSKNTNKTLSTVVSNPNSPLIQQWVTTINNNPLLVYHHHKVNHLNSFFLIFFLMIYGKVHVFICNNRRNQESFDQLV